jgi:predicted GNAT family acetyltransferase
VIIDNPDRERFEIRVSDELAGFAQYRRRPGLMAFIHTEIDPRFEGQGLGSQLIAGALDAAREAGLAVLPFCPFVNAFIGRHPEYVSLVPAARGRPRPAEVLEDLVHRQVDHRFLPRAAAPRTASVASVQNR